SGVEEFIYLIKNAQLVVTDSFHGTIFSILMNIPFIVLSRKENNKLLDMNSRIETLLELFGYQDRYIVNGKCNLSEDEILHMDFSDVKAIQEREIERSTAYMKKALNLE
ncbi:polysaccharide pyruvyl transferase family protein, partial [Megamonas funiformis]